MFEDSGSRVKVRHGAGLEGWASGKSRESPDSGVVIKLNILSFLGAVVGLRRRSLTGVEGFSEVKLNA